MLSKGGYFQEQEIRKGTGNLLTELLMKETKNYSSAEINNFFDENGIEISSSIQPDAFSTSIKTTSDELNNALNSIISSNQKDIFVAALDGTAYTKYSSYQINVSQRNYFKLG